MLNEDKLPSFSTKAAPARFDPSPRSTDDRADSWGRRLQSLWHTGHSGHLTPPAGRRSDQSPGDTERSRSPASRSHKLEREKQERAVNLKETKKLVFIIFYIYYIIICYLLLLAIVLPSLAFS